MTAKALIISGWRGSPGAKAAEVEAREEAEAGPKTPVAEAKGGAWAGAEAKAEVGAIEEAEEVPGNWE